MPSFVEIGPLVQEKTFKGFLPYMGMAAIKWFRRRRSLNIFVIYMYIAPGWRGPLGSKFFSELPTFSPFAHFLQYLPFK